MAVFQDQNGREWVLKIHAPMIVDIQSETEVDLRSIDSLSALLGDPVGLVNVLWVMVREQAGPLGVLPRNFGESLVGDAIEKAAEALVKAYRDFSPASTRALIDESMGSAAAVEAKRAKLQMAVLAKNYAEVNARLDAAILSTASPSATDSPESSVSTLGG